MMDDRYTTCRNVHPSEEEWRFYHIELGVPPEENYRAVRVFDGECRDTDEYCPGTATTGEECAYSCQSRGWWWSNWGIETNACCCEYKPKWD